jgi:hypothetical protein
MTLLLARTLAILWQDCSACVCFGMCGREAAWKLSGACARSSFGKRIIGHDKVGLRVLAAVNDSNICLEPFLSVWHKPYPSRLETRCHLAFRRPNVA